MRPVRSSSRALLLASISVLTLPLAAPAVAQTAVDEIIVTATRRDSTVQNAPINIAAVGQDAIEAQGLTDLADAAKFVPGVNIIDQGGRDGNLIIVRGLNADPLGASEGVDDGGGTVATYLGEIPLFVELRLKDIERVEFLLGPQGTLYGAGTLGGAIRYIPVKPKFTGPSLELRGDAYGYSEGEGVSSDFGFTANYALTDSFAIRASLDSLTDKGFIDYKYVVDTIGVSNPNVFDAANTHSVEDANTEETLTGRLALRWAPTDRIDATLTYHYQKQEVGARQISSQRVDTLPVPIGPYESALRVLEPSERDTQLLSLEATLDLGFASLTSATGVSRNTEGGQRDQTDLLIGLEYSYEAFPSFTAYTREDSEKETLNQEFRLVSKSEGPFSWIAGAFYNRLTSDAASKEFTPGYAAFNGGSRPDNLEYYSVDKRELEEVAFYGEAAYELTPAWQVTVGARRYSYDLKTQSAVDFPLYNSVFGGAGPNDITLDFEEGGQKDDGWLYKFNTSYRFSDDLMVYGTVSEGYRIGNSNGVAPCPTPLPPNQIACALPDELAYTPDKTVNYELGAKTQWFDRRLVVNGAVYYIEWTGVQVGSATANGLIPITKNAPGAQSKGFEVNFSARPTSQFSVRGSFSASDAELTELALNLLPHINPPGFQSTLTYDDGQEGDRLPGSPKAQGSLFATYTVPVADGLDVDFAYGVAAQSNVLTRTGGRASGVVLDGFSIHTVSATLKAETWSTTFYVKNLWDEYAETAARGTPLTNQVVENAASGPVYHRGFYASVAPPRTIGVRLSKRFGG